MRLILQFEKFGPARFISHLDVLRTLQRALRRAQIPMAYSQGFNPHMLLSFATALSLGMCSTAELLDLRTTQDIRPEEVVDRLNAAFPEGFRAVRAREIDLKEPVLTKSMKWAGYEVKAALDEQAVQTFMASETCLVMKKSKKGPREVNIRPMVRAFDWDEKNGVAKLVLECNESGGLSPALLLSAMGVEGGARITRTALFGERDGALTDLFDGGLVQ